VRLLQSLRRPLFRGGGNATNPESVKALKENGRADPSKPLRQHRAGEPQPAIESIAIRRSEPGQTDRAPGSTGSQMLTINEVAELLRLHPTTVYRLAKKGALPAFKIGYSWRFDAQELNRWRGEQYRLPSR
jgi:excisionase family DNA binding protein